jgi:hypothetical protein
VTEFFEQFIALELTRPGSIQFRSAASVAPSTPAWAALPIARSELATRLLLS